MIRARAHPLQILLLSMLAAFTSPPLEASGQQWPAIAGRDDWSTDFSKHTVPLEEFTSGGPPKDGIRSIDRPELRDGAGGRRLAEGPRAHRRSEGGTG